MSLYLCVEEEYLSSSWCNEILAGLSLEKKRKRIKITTVRSIQEIPPQPIGDRASVILVGTRHRWLAQRIDEVRAGCMNPILLCNTQQGGIYAKYSIVSSDVFGAIHSAMTLFKENQKPRVALYGINPDSSSDVVRKNAFLTFGGTKRDIFYNNGLLKGCFYSFYPVIEQYDAVLCANAFAAISLVNRLKKSGYSYQRLAIISCTDSVLCRQSTPSITALTVQFESFGKAAIALHETLSKNPFITSLSSLIGYTLFSGDTTEGMTATLSAPPTYQPDPEQSVNIYQDAELTELIAAEALLRGADKDPLDLKILTMLRDKQTLESISDATYLSISAVKYRIRNLSKMFGVASVAELLETTAKYL